MIVRRGSTDRRGRRSVARGMVLGLVAPVLIAVAATACHDATAPPTSAMRLPDNAVGQVNAKTAVCHAAGPVGAQRFVEIRVGGGGLAAHLDERGTVRAGHEGDYLVTARTPCPPPATPPNVRVCKTVDANMPVGRTFAFDVDGEAITLVGGGCAERTVRVGTPVTITEAVATGTVLDAISVSPADAGSADVAGATATVVAGIDVAQVTFTNRALLGQLALCKEIVPPGLMPGQSFGFFVTASGAGQMGQFFLISGSVPGPFVNCVSAGTYPVGTVVGVWEEVSPNPFNVGIRTTSISVLPADRLVPGTLDLATRRVSATIGEGTTQVTYVNERPLGTLRICKNAPPGSTSSTQFTVDAVWADGTSLLQVPANGCATYDRGFGPGGVGVPLDAIVDIRETVPAGQTLASISVDPMARLVTTNLPSGFVRLRTGTGLTTVTFVNVATAP